MERRPPHAPAVDPSRSRQRPSGRHQRHRYALWKNPEDLTEKQQIKLAWIVQTGPRLARAYFLKEGLRMIFKPPRDEANEALCRC